MILPDFHITPSGAVLTLGDGHTTVLLTPADCRALGDKCRAAEQQLTELNMARADELDREAARAMAAADRAGHDEWGWTLQHHAPPIQHVPVRRECGCMVSERCPECQGKSA